MPSCNWCLLVGCTEQTLVVADSCGTSPSSEPAGIGVDVAGAACGVCRPSA